MEVWLISPLMEMGSVRKILDSHFPEGIPESAASPIIRDILLGLVHLHERGIVHRALKVFISLKKNHILYMIFLNKILYRNITFLIFGILRIARHSFKFRT